MQNNESATPSNNYFLSQVLTFYRRLGFQAGDEIWVQDYSQTFKGTLLSDGIELWACEKASVDADGVGIWKPTHKISDPIAHLRTRAARPGKSMVAYPNHLRGGMGNKHASQFTTIFYEIDDLTREEQEAKIKWFKDVFGLTPCVVVFTGGKSLHVYFRLSRPVDKETWLRLMRKLAVVAKGDPAICNPARAMRLPGVPRFKDGMLNEVEVVSQSDAQYSPDDFEALLDSTGLFPFGVDSDRFRLWRKDKDNSFLLEPPAPVAPKKERSIITPALPSVPTNYTGPAVPLEVCLSKHDRELVAGGVGTGDRNNYAFKLTRNAVGTESRLNQLGISYTGTAYEILQDFGSRCSPPMSTHEINQIWRSANRNGAVPSLTDDAILNCAAAWIKRNSPNNDAFLVAGASEKPKPILRSQPFNFYEKLLREFSWSVWTLSESVKNYCNRGLYRHWKKQHSDEDPKRPEGTPIYERPQKKEDAGRVPKESAIVPMYDGILIYESPLFTVNPSGERVFVYRPGNAPTREEWEFLNRPVVQFAPGQRRRLDAELRSKGWKNIKDKSGTGSGKSHDMGLTNINDYEGINRIFYVTNDPENPTTITVEYGFERLTARHDGLKYDHTHHTPAGKPHKRRIKKGEIPDIMGNCPETHTFHKFQAKGIIIGAGKDSPICQACPRFAGCEYLGTRKQQINHSQKLILHPDQVTKDFKDLPQTFAIWDEPAQIIKTNQLIHFGWAELERAYRSLAVTHSELHRQLTPIMNYLYAKINGLKIHQKFGVSADILLKELHLPEVFITEQSGSIFSTVGVMALARAVDKAVNSGLSFSGIQSPAEKQQWIDDEWHPKFFERLFGAFTGTHEKTSVTIDKNLNFTLSVPYTRHQKLVASTACNTFLDATQSVEDLAMMIDVPVSEIIEIVEESPVFSNLDVEVIKGVGGCGMNREDESEYSLQRRLDVLVDHLKLRGTITSVIDFKKHLAGRYDGTLKGYWFKDSRGSNAFVESDNHIGIGSPLLNLQALASQWQSMTGELVCPTDLTGAYGAWVERGVIAEIIQLVGRLRAQRSKNPKLCHLVSDRYPAGLKAALLKAFPGCRVTVKDVEEVCIFAAPKGKQRCHQVVGVMWDNVQAGMKNTVRSVAATLGLSPGRISHLVAPLGGWDALEGCLLFLYRANKGKVNKEDLPPAVKELVKRFLPTVWAAIPEKEDTATLPIDSPPPPESETAEMAEVLSVFTMIPLDCAKGLADTVAEWHGAYFAAVWQKLGSWQRRFVQTFAHTPLPPLIN